MDMIGQIYSKSVIHALGNNHIQLKQIWSSLIDYKIWMDRQKDTSSLDSLLS